MDAVELVAGLFFLRFPVGHAYLCVDRDGLTLIDTSVPGSGRRGQEPADHDVAGEHPGRGGGEQVAGCASGERHE